MKKSVYEIINERIFSQNLKKVSSPGRKPWKTIDRDANFIPPQNFVTHKPYQGINFFLLNNAFDEPYYLTFKQIPAGKRWNIEKGPHGIPVAFWKPFDVEKRDDNGEIKTEPKLRLRYYTVFN